MRGRLQKERWREHGTCYTARNCLKVEAFRKAGLDGPRKQGVVKAQTVTPCSSPTSMAAKTAVKSVVKSPPPPSWSIRRDKMVVDREVEPTPSGKDIMAANKICSETLN